MIRIEDHDGPLTTASKIVNGTRPYKTTPLAHALSVAITGEKQPEQESEVDMFTVEEIKEIADYLICFYEHHKEEQ